jgi:uncharacterized protein (UPF0261 family)
MVPTGGYDSYAVAGQGFHDPEADQTFVDELRKRLPQNIRMIERPSHAEDAEFAAEAATQLIALIQARQNRSASTM